MAHQCKICFNDFSWDPSAKDKSHLPVQSRVCSHILCFSCLVNIFEASPAVFNNDNHHETMDCVSCPECRLHGAHNPFAPIFSLAVCNLLAEREQLVQLLPYDCTESPMYAKNELARALELARQSLWNLCGFLQSELVKERPFWKVRMTKEIARAVYWGNVAFFGRIKIGESIGGRNHDMLEDIAGPNSPARRNTCTSPRCRDIW